MFANPNLKTRSVRPVELGAKPAQCQKAEVIACRKWTEWGGGVAVDISYAKMVTDLTECEVDEEGS